MGRMGSLMSNGPLNCMRYMAIGVAYVCRLWQCCKITQIVLSASQIYSKAFSTFDGTQYST